MKTYKILLAISLLFAMTTMSMAQEIDEPDYKQIRQAITNSRGPHYYPTLMRRYVECDTTLTLEQYRYLYYGYTLQEDFVPYKSSKKALTDARKRFTKAHGESTLAPEMIRLAKAQLDDNPFDIPAINMIAVSYLQIGDTVQYNVWDIKQKGIIDAIISTGDGAEPESAFHVIDLEHEYEVLHRLGLTVESDKLISNEVEYLKVKENAEGEEGFYFNFGACRNVYKKKYE